MATQSRGAPYPLGSDANNTATDLQALALWVNDRPGVAALTTTQRNALSGVDRWDGKLVLDTTLDRLYRWDAGSTTWIQLPDTGDIAALLATTGLPAQDAVTASRGVSASAARADHVHPEAAWQAYTPTLGGGFTPGAGATLVGRFVQHGKTVHFKAQWTLGTGFTIANGIGLSLPTARSVASPTYSNATAILGAVGNNTFVAGTSYSGNFLNVFVPGGNGAAVAIATTVPFTWKATDSIEVAGTYEAA